MMITDEQKEKALKFVEAIKNAIQSPNPTDADLALIYENKNLIVNKDLYPYLKIGALNANGTIANFSGWRIIYKVPVYKGDIVKLDLGEAPSAYGTTAFIVYDKESNILLTRNNQKEIYTISQDGFVSFCYNHDIMNNSYSIISYDVTNAFNELKNSLGGGNVTWAAIGDSITAGTIDNTGSSYATIAKDLLGSNRVVLNKLGYYGYTMKDTLATIAFNGINQGTDIVTINFGSNDIFVLGSRQWGDIDEIIAKPRETLQDGVSTYESLRLFLEKMRENYPSTLIYVITPIKRGDISNAATVSDYIERGRKLCAYYSIPYLNANEESGIRYNDSVYLADGVHPNDAGKLLIARWLVSKISFLNL